MNDRTNRICRPCLASALAPFLFLPLLAACAAEEATSKHDEDRHAEEPSRDEADLVDGGEHEAEGSGHDDSQGALHLEGVRGVSFVVVAEPREEGAWFAGEAISDPGAEAALSAPVSGRVTAFRSSPGSSVAAGAAVIELESPELADLAAAHLSAKARAARALRDVERERALAKSGATSARELEAAEAESAVTAAEERGARLALTGRGVDPESTESTFLVRAPRGGIVARFDVALGESVEAGRRLGTLVAPGAALVQVELPLPGPQSWPAGAVTEARRSDGRRWRATVEGTPPALSPETRRLAFRLRLGDGELPGSSGELPLAGTPLEVRVPLARAVVLPQTALQQIEGVWGVFVRSGEGADEATFRPVTKGAELGGDAMILAGVTPGESVATDGAYLLKALWLKRAGGGGGHDH
jgi:multidrug efflux pump subunit AcrA (membrane-fusion protein)